MQKLAIIGSTASGKSDLAISIAQEIDAYILSIDSLSVYKEIDIVSAKPSKDDLATIEHFGIDEIYPNEYFSVELFIKIYKRVLKKCNEDKKNLIIVGGTSFYLKSLLDGLSPIPTITDEHIVEFETLGIQKSYDLLSNIDAKYMQNIAQSDKYRIEKAMLIYLATKLSPSQYFLQNPPKPIIEDLPIFNIDVDREILRDRIDKRTKKMYTNGLIDEVCYLEQKYGRAIHPMNSIGIVEVLEYLDRRVSIDEMLQNISTHTAQLAKRQQTFNKTQFSLTINAPLEKLTKIILSKIT